MHAAVDAHAVYLEVGKKRTFAGGLDWPGWCRSGKDEPSALQALIAAGPRYAQVLRGSGLLFAPPATASSLTVVERLPGNATTDFGAPDAVPSVDAQPFDEAELNRSGKLLGAIWQAFDASVSTATGRDLRKGPRGGGRDLDGIVRHVLEVDAGYLRQLGRKLPKDATADVPAQLARVRDAILAALAAALRGEIPALGPRGGKLWTPRYFVRRVAWHTLDHAWEIEDRIVH